MALCRLTCSTQVYCHIMNITCGSIGKSVTQPNGDLLVNLKTEGL